jgi:hypothetical protein
VDRGFESCLPHLLDRYIVGEKIGVWARRIGVRPLDRTAAASALQIG